MNTFRFALSGREMELNLKEVDANMFDKVRSSKSINIMQCFITSILGLAIWL